MQCSVIWFVFCANLVYGLVCHALSPFPLPSPAHGDKTGLDWRKIVWLQKSFQGLKLCFQKSRNRAYSHIITLCRVSSQIHKLLPWLTCACTNNDFFPFPLSEVCKHFNNYCFWGHVPCIHTCTCMAQIRWYVHVHVHVHVLLMQKGGKWKLSFENTLEININYDEAYSAPYVCSGDPLFWTPLGQLPY